jgi:hypothetical protein
MPKILTYLVLASVFAAIVWASARAFGQNKRRRRRTRRGERIDLFGSRAD